MNIKSKRGTVSLTCYAEEARAIERVLAVLRDLKKYADGDWPKAASVLEVGLTDLKATFCKQDCEGQLELFTEPKTKEKP